jgi:hypothetical protein
MCIELLRLFLILERDPYAALLESMLTRRSFTSSRLLTHTTTSSTIDDIVRRLLSQSSPSISASDERIEPGPQLSCRVSHVCYRNSDERAAAQRVARLRYHVECYHHAPHLLSTPFRAAWHRLLMRSQRTKRTVGVARHPSSLRR